MNQVRATDHRPWTRDALAAALLAATALLAFVLVGRAVESHATASVDGAIQSWVLAHQATPAHVVLRWITLLGGITGMRVVAVLGAAALWFRWRGWTAASLLVVPVAADILFHVAKGAHERARPLGLGEGADSSYSFPSGHATVSAAVCGTLAYLLFREGLIGREAALSIGVLVPLLVGISRVYLNVHWATDVLGGWCAGLFVAALWTALYAYERGRRVQ